MIEVSVLLIGCLFGFGMVVMQSPPDKDDEPTPVDVADLPRSSLDVLLGE